jgi:hypothetical protein
VDHKKLESKQMQLSLRPPKQLFRDQGGMTAIVQKRKDEMIKSLQNAYANVRKSDDKPTYQYDM